MYLEHFGLREMPFTLTPDTAFFMSRAGYQDALNVLLVALRSGEGFVKVTGEVGTGKTMLCRTLLKTLGEDFATAYIPNPYLRPTTLLLAIADELGIDYPEKIGQHAFMRLLNQALLDIHEGGRRVLVCLDEAQAMPLETLETLRLLTNLETEKSKLIQVVLFGQPELDGVLEQPSIRQLRQRITFAYQIQPLNRVGMEHYVAHRLAVAGHAGPPLLGKRALDQLHVGSAGVPRLVNILMHKALMSAFGTGTARIEPLHVARAIADTSDARRCTERPLWWRRLPRRWLAGSVGAAAVAGIGFAALHAGDVLAMLP
ncbi:MAG: AAA family ATPase [Gammaproteobacteria bacterium]|nr:AAA family ATPase [Gammaproteobacteria bacterium]MCP5199302.1 AAA family ATPase [Gammaproteobacteria bacterium]